MQDNVETLRAAYEAITHGDLDAAFRMAAPEVEWKTSDRVPNAGTYRGREDVVRFLRDQRAAFDGWIAEPEQFFECGDQIVVFVRMQLRPKGSTAEFEVRIAHLWTMHGGQGMRCEVFPQREQALEAVGLSE